MRCSEGTADALTREAAKAALMDALDGEDEVEAVAAVDLALAEGVPLTQRWLATCMEPVTAFKLSRDQHGEVSVAVMRQPRVMCRPGVAVRVDVPVDNPTTCMDAMAVAGESAVNAFLRGDEKLRYVVFEGPGQPEARDL